MAERRVTVGPGVGLHARPAALFVQATAKLAVDVRIAKVDSESVNAKSILAVLGLDVRGGDEVVLTADGDGAEAALDQLAATLTSGEHE